MLQGRCRDFVSELEERAQGQSPMEEQRTPVPSGAGATEPPGAQISHFHSCPVLVLF